MATSAEAVGYPSRLFHPVSPTGRSTVHNGISDRSISWKSRRIGDLMEGRLPPNARPSIKRWDGGAKACAAWDSLRRVSFDLRRVAPV